uniref:Mon2/Sec7/BIG1-like HDS domain-containing protein n=1 Tax=Physcomitrium patens TaxID=3218 RepID=A0A2K1KUP7_PHYPA|nr:hypothetical protein PHYPA_004501 [Physcomitrium patens]
MDLMMDCIIQIIKSKVRSIKSEWQSMFMVFTIAEYNGMVSISNVVFENVE